MSTSQNGWPVVDVAATTPLPAITGRVLSGDVWVIFNYLARRYDAEVEPIIKGHSWGYAKRTIRGSTTTASNHASGTAVDFNAPAHPLGKRGTFSKAQVAALRRIYADLDRMAGGQLLRSGIDYANRADEMHHEVVGSKAMVARVADAIRRGAGLQRVGGKTIEGFIDLWRLEQQWKRTWSTPSSPLKAKLGAELERKRAMISPELAARIEHTVRGDLAYLKAKRPDLQDTIRGYERNLVPYADWLADHVA